MIKGVSKNGNIFYNLLQKLLPTSGKGSKKIMENLIIGPDPLPRYGKYKVIFSETRLFLEHFL